MPSWEGSIQYSKQSLAIAWSQVFPNLEEKVRS